MRILKFLTLITPIIFLITGCDDTFDVDDIDNRPIPDNNVSFAEHIQPVLEFKCTPCHNSSSPGGGISFETWSSTTSDPSVVFPGEPDNSRLVWAIEGRAGVSIMPPINSPYAPFTSRQLFGLRKWIEEGAQNN